MFGRSIDSRTGNSAAISDVTLISDALSAIALSDLHFFLLVEDVSRHLFSEWIDFRSMGMLDMAITNRKMRVVWLQRAMTYSVTGDWMHSNSSLK